MMPQPTRKVKFPPHKTKIVCTIGPASSSESVIEELIKKGMSVARLNFSHGNIEEHRRNIRRIRSAASKVGRIVAILTDLPGPKIRVGTLRTEPVTLNRGDDVTLTTKDVLGTSSLIPLDRKELPEYVSLRKLIYLNDGFIQLEVREVDGDEIKCRVIIGGELLSHKGINLPGTKLPLDPVTDKDLDFLQFGLEEDVDAFSVSFVEKAGDIIKVKDFAEKMGKSAFVVAKVERETAVENIDEILKAADGLMVARGDLGTEIPIEEVPGVQKKLIRRANLFSKPVITATQMLESMLQNIRPTRAEVTDVANAILDGSDAVMLSEETALGRYPVESVEMVAKIAKSIERQRHTLGPRWDLKEQWSKGGEGATVEDAISLNAVEDSRTLRVRFILTPTHSGSTPRRVSRFKPDCWVLSFSENERVRNFLALSYGVYPFLVNDEKDHDKIIALVKESGLAKKGDKVILTAGVSPQAGGTDSLRIITL